MATLLTQAVQNGTVFSGSMAVPAGASRCAVNLPMTDADALNAANSCLVYVGFSWDGVAYDYGKVPPYSWVGGTTNPRSGNPQAPSTVFSPVPTDAGGNLPALVMVKVDQQGNTMNFGVAVTFP